MQLSRRIWLAVLAGAVTEGILMAPMFLANFFGQFPPVDPLWFRSQYPGLTIVVWLWHIVAAGEYGHMHVRGYQLALAASAIAMLIQALIFAVLALMVTYIVRSRISKHLLIAMFAPPLAGLVIVGASMFPYLLLGDDEAGLVISISIVWLALAVLVAGTNLATRRISTV